MLYNINGESNAHTFPPNAEPMAKKEVDAFTLRKGAERTALRPLISGLDWLRPFFETLDARGNRLQFLKRRQTISVKPIVSPFYATVDALEREAVLV